MSFRLIIIGILGIIFEKKIFPSHTSAFNKVATISTGVLIVANSVSDYLSEKPPNLYEMLEVGRAISTEKLLRLIKRNTDFSSYYEDVKNNIYETNCISKSPQNYFADSFTYYGIYLLIINFISFFKKGPSRLLLLFLVLNIGAEILLINRYFQINFVVYTICEQIQILRQMFLGVGFIIYNLMSIREKEKIQQRKDFIEDLKKESVEVTEFSNMIQIYGLGNLYDFVSMFEKFADNEAKSKAMPNRLKKPLKYMAALLMLYSLFASNSGPSRGPR